MKVLTLSPTNKCPLKCNHCGPKSGPGENGEMEFNKIRATIREFYEIGFGHVNFTGGEPLLLGERLVDLVKYANTLTLKTRVTTGAYWSKSESVAMTKMAGLAAAGLNELYISVSDSHLEFVTLKNVLYASRAARKNNIKVTIGLLTFRGSNTSLKSIIDFFAENKEPTPFINCAPMIPVGRADEKFNTDQLQLQPLANIAGPCPSVLNHPMVHSNGVMTACSSVFSQDCDSLKVGNINDAPAEELIKRMKTYPLLVWFHKFGLVALKEMLEKDYQMKFDNEYVNICHLCSDLLNNPKVTDILRKERFLQP